MENNGGKLAFGVTIKDEATPKLKELEREINSLATKSGSQFNGMVNELSDGIKGLGNTIDGISGSLEGLTAFFAGGAGISMFLKKIYDVRSSFQDIESSMQVFLGSAEKAAKFTQDLKDYAYYNMFEFSDLAEASKQLIAYGQDVEKISGKGGILDQLSNVATATKQPLMDMVNLYNKAKATGTVDSMALQTWAKSGVVIKDILKEMGENAEVSSVSFDQLNKVLEHVTSEGGMFAGIMDNMMDNLSSSIGQLQDNLASMFNEIGEQMQEPMKEAIDFAGVLIDNYQVIGKTLVALVTTYGTYRAALVAVNVAEKIAAIRKGELAVATLIAEKAQLKYNLAAYANPYVLMATAIVGVITALTLFSSKTETTEDKVENLNNATNELGETMSKVANIRALCDEYDTLMSKTDKTTEDTIRLTRVIQELADYMPSAVTKFDKFGKSISIDSTKVRALAEGEGAAAAANAKSEREKLITERHNLQRQIEEDRKILELGTVAGKGRKNEANGTRFKATQEQINEAAARIIDNEAKLSNVSSAMDHYNKQLDGFYAVMDDFKGQLSNLPKDQLDKVQSEIENMMKEGKPRIIDVGNLKFDFTGSMKNYVEDFRNAINQVQIDNKYLRPKELEDALKKSEKRVKELQKKYKAGTLTEQESSELKTESQNLNSLKSVYQQRTDKKYLTQEDRSKLSFDNRKKQIEEDKALAREREKVTLDAQQRQIELMDEGYAKERAQNQLNFDKEMIEIRKQREDKLKAIQDLEKNRWLREDPNRKEKDFIPTTTVLSQEDNAIYDQMAQDALDRLTKANVESFQAISKEYGTMKDKMLAIERDWGKKIKSVEESITKTTDLEQQRQLMSYVEAMKAKMQLEKAKAEYDEISQYGTSGQKEVATEKYYKAMIDEAPDYLKPGMEKAFEEAMANLNIEKFKKSMNWDGIFGDLSLQGIGDLQANMKKVQEYLTINRDNLGIQEIKELQDAITRMSDEVQSRNPLAGIVQSVQDLKDAKTEYAEAAKAYIQAQEVKAQADEDYEMNMTEIQSMREFGSLSEAEAEQAVLVATAERDKATQNLEKSENRLAVAQNKLTSGGKKLESNIRTTMTMFNAYGDSASELASIFNEDIGAAIGKTVNTLTDIGDSVMDVLDKIGVFGGGMIQNIQTMTNATIEGVKGTSEGASAAIKAVEAASVILLIIQVAIKVLTAVFQIVKANNEANEKAIENAEKYKNAIRDLREEQERLYNSNLFGEDTWGTFSSNVKQASQRLNDMNEQIRTMAKDNKLVFNWGAAIFGGIGGIKQAVDESKRVVDDFIVDMRSGWQKFIGSDKNIITKSVSDFLDADGKVKVNELKAFYDTYKDSMDGATKKNIEALIESGEAYEENMKAIKDYLSGIFGSLGNEIADALVDAFKAGEDAAQRFGESMSKVIEKFVKEVAYSKFLQPIFDKMSKEMEGTMANGNLSDEQKIQSMLSALGRGMDQLTETQESYNNFLQGAKEMADEKGFEIFGNERSSSNQGIATASQESVDELNGRMTAVQGHTYILSENSKIMVATTNEILHQVMGIHDDTSLIQNDISDMKGRIKDMHGDISDIATRGVRMLS